MPITNFNSIADLQHIGFTGFKTVHELWADYSCIPDAPGVYLVLTPKQDPIFLTTGVGGFFKGKDPNVDEAVLKREWVSGAQVIYIGKAGGPSSGATLKKRLKQYLRFGQGKNVGHWGGRYIWQLENHADLIFCWKETGTKDPLLVEQSLIHDFQKQYRLRPFANLTG